MSGRWSLGSEVKHKSLQGGAMLYDASRAGNLTPAWFDPQHWESNGAIEGRARGRGAALFIKANGKQFVLRHYRRGGLMGWGLFSIRRAAIRATTVGGAGGGLVAMARRLRTW